MKTKLAQLKKEMTQKLAKISNSQLLLELENEYLGRNGELNKILKNLKDLSLELRQEIGQSANQLKNEMMAEIEILKNKFGQKNQELISDVSLPGDQINAGHFNPITLVQRELNNIFNSLGFLILDGPELESDYYNFEALNIPADHPARDMQDTFYIDKPGQDGKFDLLMRTQTSPVQIRAMKKYGAPLKMISAGRVFRNEATDARHEHTFYQVEGLIVGKNLSFANLKALLEVVGQKLYGANTKLRLRPKFYPFVEPGANGEYTCFLCQGHGCRVCKNTGWLEIVGCGMVHPEVLKSGGLDPKIWSGLAFGFGLNRLAMLKYNIDDIRLFNSGDLKFLEQF
jgi:phenylalanyl-tRNA synthetase alpha chain